jgi:cytochrome c oxidase subunit I+III
MLITMLADITAFASIVFGYFFYWTLRPDFPPAAIQGPGVMWPCIGLALIVCAWALTLLVRRWNKRDIAGAVYIGLFVAALLAVAGACAMLAGPWVTRMDPKEHVYPATVWLLVIWTAVHALAGVIMQLYCIAGRAAGRMTGRYDVDIQNVGLYWHFVVVTAAVTVVVTSGLPSLR